MSDRIENIVIEDAKIMFRNFSGKQGRFNAAGNRNFCLLVDSELAATLAADGWNVKHLDPRDEDDEVQYYLQVGIRFDIIPPVIYLISGNKKTKLDEDTISALDYAEIENIDIVVRPYRWTWGQDAGVKAYVKNMYVTIARDEFADKYVNVPDSVWDGVDVENM